MQLTIDYLDTFDLSESIKLEFLSIHGITGTIDATAQIHYEGRLGNI